MTGTSEVVEEGLDKIAEQSNEMISFEVGAAKCKILLPNLSELDRFRGSRLKMN